VPKVASALYRSREIATLGFVRLGDSNAKKALLEKRSNMRSKTV
jgi:hypothetical protein